MNLLKHLHSPVLIKNGVTPVQPKLLPLLDIIV